VEVTEGRVNIDEADKFARLRTAIGSHRFRWTNEDELQLGVAEALQSAGIPAIREHAIAEAGRVDFFWDGIVVELKTRAALADVLRQLVRYAECDVVQGIVLVTASLRLRTPPTLAAKPAATIYVPSLT
jgi:hypothetical protein